jgi:uncharacterized SAM-binding protein YcdF (DUF218 family)
LNWFATNFISAFLLPPLNLLLLGGVGAFLCNRRPQLGRALVVLSLASLFVLSTPDCATYLLGLLERPPGRASIPEQGADAIVVLGAGTYFNAPEYGADTVNSLSLERLRYAARLQRETGKPLLVTGGSPAGGTAEGVLMKTALERDFRVPVQWSETASDNTRENAVFSARILKQSGVDTIYLVTHAWHMPRAQREFEHAAMKVIPTATGFTSRRDLHAMDFLPSAKGMLQSHFAMHEAIGLAWYSLRQNNRVSCALIRFPMESAIASALVRDGPAAIAEALTILSSRTS